MEILDIVNEKDEVTGSAAYSEIYEKKLTYRIAHVLIFNRKGGMALQFRSKNKSFCPHHWSTSVGGHVRSGESYEQAAMRESMEELGLKTKIIFAYKDFYEGPEGLKKFLATFRAQSDGPFKINRKEVEKMEFFSLNKIRKMINSGEKFHPELLFLLEKHFKASQDKTSSSPR